MTLLWGLPLRARQSGAWPFDAEAACSEAAYDEVFVACVIWVTRFIEIKEVHSKQKDSAAKQRRLTGLVPTGLKKEALSVARSWYLTKQYPVKNASPDLHHLSGLAPPRNVGHWGRLLIASTRRYSGGYWLLSETE